jgi:flagellar hook assembly protein FlgD
MKTFIFSLVILLSLDCVAQSDFLIVNLKSGTKDTIKVSDIATIRFENITSVEESTNLSFTGNYPNPFAETTTIEFNLERAAKVDILIYDNSGNTVRQLYCGECPAGTNIFKWDAKNQKGDPVPSGIYFYEIHSSNNVLFKQMIKVR